jgi:hypothetical protein
MINIFSENDDHVINGKFLTGVADYSFGIERLFPLVGKLDIQRRLQSPKFYDRLRRDLLKGCIMPNLTLALVQDNLRGVNLSDFVNQRIDEAFVLDGIQRLNTLKRASEEPELDLSRPLFLDIIICPSIDNLLYRMITLNNGQKPMSARHQIEILASNLLDFDQLPITTQTEKESGRGRPVPGFRKADIIKAYIAFLGNLVDIDNQKIIEEKMDELIAERVLDSDITVDHLEFSQVLSLVVILLDHEFVATWLKNANNLIGFAVGIKKSFATLAATPLPDFANSLQVFEEAFTSIDISKIKLGQVRRRLVEHFIAHYERLADSSPNELVVDFLPLI